MVLGIDLAVHPHRSQTAWAGLDVLGLPESEPCVIEDLVDISQERRPVHATLRSTRIVAFGRLGQCKGWASTHEVADGADGLVDGPTAAGLVAAAYAALSPSRLLSVDVIALHCAPRVACAPGHGADSEQSPAPAAVDGLACVCFD
jgi:hypothetical protein